MGLKKERKTKKSTSLGVDEPHVGRATAVLRASLQAANKASFRLEGLKVELDLGPVCKPWSIWFDELLAEGDSPDKIRPMILAMEMSWSKALVQIRPELLGPTIGGRRPGSASWVKQALIRAMGSGRLKAMGDSDAFHATRDALIDGVAGAGCDEKVESLSKALSKNLDANTEVERFTALALGMARKMEMARSPNPKSSGVRKKIKRDSSA